MFTFAPHSGNAQMAESVDALVSNTSGVTSIPVRPRVWVQIKRLSIELSITWPFCLSGFSPHFPHRRKKYSSKLLFSLATQYKYTTFEKK